MIKRNNLTIEKLIKEYLEAYIIDNLVYLVYI